MTILLIVYILSGHFVVGALPFNSFAACEVYRERFAAAPVTITAACFTNV